MTLAPVPQSLLHVVNLSGRVVGNVPAPSDGSAQYGVGPHHVWVAVDHSLTFYGASGATLATDAYSEASFSSPPIFSADGSNWVWSYSPNQADLQHGGTTTIYMGTQASQMTSVATHLEGVGSRLTPIAWVGGKVYFTEYVVIGGGRIIFSVGTGAWSLDPSTGELVELDASCHLEDVSSDGSLLCLQGRTLTVIHPGARATALTLAGLWDEWGAGAFSADGRKVIVSAVSFQTPGSVGATFMGNAAGGLMVKASDAAFGVYFFPDGRYLAQASTGWLVASLDGTKRSLALPAGDTVVGVLATPAG